MVYRTRINIPLNRKQIYGVAGR
ncbi:hypothetical protein MNBD_GAMMA05-2349, partial [hydrothermal vent metagenome]